MSTSITISPSRQTLSLVGATPGPTGPAGVSAVGNLLITAGGVAINAPGYLVSVTVVAMASDPVTLTDGPGGPPIAIVPANHPAGDIALYQPKRFLTSLVAVYGANSPQLAIGYA